MSIPLHVEEVVAHPTCVLVLQLLLDHWYSSIKTTGYYILTGRDPFSPPCCFFTGFRAGICKERASLLPESAASVIPWALMKHSSVIMSSAATVYGGQWDRRGSMPTSRLTDAYDETKGIGSVWVWLAWQATAVGMLCLMPAQWLAVLLLMGPCATAFPARDVICGNRRC